MVVVGPEGQKGKKRCTRPRWPVILLPLLCLHDGAFRPAFAAISTRGMSPEEIVLFSARETFECRYSGKVLPVSRLNDDFCDCPEGTDEPGTSACAYGVFYCANKGHIPVRLPSSRINDGICDCCDGSDEYNGWVKCERTCSQAAAALGDSSELAEMMERDLEGARLRQKIIWRALHKGAHRATRGGRRRTARGMEHQKRTGGTGSDEGSANAEDGKFRQRSVEEEEEEAAAAAAAAVGGGTGAGQMLGLEVATSWLLLAVLFSVCWARMRALSRAPWRRRGSFRRLRSRELSLGSFPRDSSLGAFPRVPSVGAFPRQARAAQAAIFT